MLTVKQAAGRASLRRWSAVGRPPDYRLGAAGRRGKIMIDDADLDALPASPKVGGKEVEPAPVPALNAPAPHVFRHLRVH